MRKRTLVTVIAAVAMLWAALPASADRGAGELNASFHAFGSGGLAIDALSEVAANVASPQLSPEGRIAPFGEPRSVCDELLLGTWIIWFTDDGDKEFLNNTTNEFKLDGEVLELTRTPIKRFNIGPGADGWWFAEGVPVLGTLDPGVHEIEWTFTIFDDFTETIVTEVEVDESYC